MYQSFLSGQGYTILPRDIHWDEKKKILKNARKTVKR